MTQQNANEQDDERLAALLRALDTNVPPPDQTLLDALRQRSAELFLSSGANVGRANVPAGMHKSIGDNSSDNKDTVAQSYQPTAADDSSSALTIAKSEIAPTSAVPMPSTMRRRSKMSIVLRGMVAL